jgi:hypothetical protein
MRRSTAPEPPRVSNAVPAWWSKSSRQVPTAFKGSVLCDPAPPGYAGLAMPGQHNWDQYAACAWSVLCTCAAEERVITYGELGRSIDLHHRSVRHVLGVIQDYCLGSQLPPLTILIVNQATRLPGEGFIAWDADDIETGMEQVYSYTNWQVLPNPFAYAVDGPIGGGALRGAYSGSRPIRVRLLLGPRSRNCPEHLPSSSATRLWRRVRVLRPLL